MFAIIWLKPETADAEDVSLEAVLRLTRTVLIYFTSSVSSKLQRLYNYRL